MPAAPGQRASASDYFCLGSLLLLGGGADADRDLHFLGTATPSHAADRACVQIISTHRQAAMTAIRGRTMGHIDGQPALLAAGPNIDPGVAGDLAVLARVKVAADVAGRNAGTATAGNVDMR